MNDRPDPDAESLQPASDELGKVYEWQGKPLHPFSAGRQTALQRIQVIGGSAIEAASALVLLCSMEPQEVARIRGDACNQFLVDLEQWMERECVGLGTAREAKTNALLDLYNRILNDIYTAEKLAPDTSGAPALGNA